MPEEALALVEGEVVLDGGLVRGEAAPAEGGVLIVEHGTAARVRHLHAPGDDEKRVNATDENSGNAHASSHAPKNTNTVLNYGTMIRGALSLNAFNAVTPRHN